MDATKDTASPLGGLLLAQNTPNNLQEGRRTVFKTSLGELQMTLLTGSCFDSERREDLVGHLYRMFVISMI